MSDALSALQTELESYADLTIAVSGGVDSLTLMHVAAKTVPNCRAIHATSPAVPAQATDLVKKQAQAHGWDLRIIDSGEFADPEYRANPHNRCYFCKSNLYATMRRAVTGAIAAGTNCDDLGEYRPGLIAADEHGVVHPYVDAGLSKSDLRGIARALGLGHIAELPAQPCLASRVTTGIHIEAADLDFINRIEQRLRACTDQEDVRCRITPDGVLLQTSETLPDVILSELRDACLLSNRKFAGWQEYARGSAFILPIT